jgi:hypothetical protein
MQLGGVVKRTRVLFVTMGAVVAFVLSYAWLVLPLDLGVGLSGGYQLLGDIGFGVGLTAVWAALTIVLVWFLGYRSVRAERRSQRYWVAVLGASVALLLSYPLVVLYMYVSLDSVMPTGQVRISALAGQAYGLLVVGAVVGVVGSPIALRLSR